MRIFPEFGGTLGVLCLVFSTCATAASRDSALSGLFSIISAPSILAKCRYWHCQGKVEMSPSRQNRNVPFSLDLGGVHVNLRVPVKRRRRMLASNPIKE